MKLKLIHYVIGTITGFIGACILGYQLYYYDHVNYFGKFGFVLLLFLPTLVVINLFFAWRNVFKK